MARGNNQTLPSNSGTLLKMLTGDIRASVLVLNPNDGVLYVVINGSASPTAWDFVVPSQSYAALPGPWESVGLYYVDQSGAGRSGNVTVYESDNHLDVPIYQAVGIARLAQASSMDIVEGTVPANPGSGILRLWVDGSDQLHGLNSAGVDETLVDSRTPAGGVLTGFYPNPGLGNGVVANGNIAGQAVDNTKIAPNTILNSNISDFQIQPGKLAGNAITKVLYDSSSSADLYNNGALSAGGNGVTGFPFTVTLDDGSGDSILILMQASFLFNGAATGGNMGFDLFIQNALYQRLSRIRMSASVQGMVSCDAAVLVTGQSGPGLQIGPVIYTDTAIPNNIYWRCASNPTLEFLRFQVLEIRK